MAKEIIVGENTESVTKETTSKRKVTKKNNTNNTQEETVEKVEEPQEEVEAKVEEPKGTVETLMQQCQEPQVTIQKEEPKTKPTTMVRIKLKEDHKCNIGGDWYVFKKDKQYNVPENVKTILARAEKLLPL